MKKILFVLCVLFLSVGTIQAKTDIPLVKTEISTDIGQPMVADVPVNKTEISVADLPVGKTFALLFFDGSPIITGVIDSKLINLLPKNVTFALSVNGKVTQYRLK